MIKLSASTLNLFLECPRCFWLHINKNIRRPEKPVATITTGLDRVIKEYFNQYRKQGRLPPLLEGKIPGKLISSLPNWLEFVDRSHDAKLYGYLDECLEIDNNLYAVLDHKTRGSIPENTHPAYQLQMDVYTFLLEKNNYPTKRLAYLVYYIPKEGLLHNGFQFHLHITEVKTEPERAKDIFYSAVSILKEGKTPKAKEECSYCNWLNLMKEVLHGGKGDRQNHPLLW